MHRSLARYSAPVSFVQAPSWADFITTMVGFEVFGTHSRPRSRVEIIPISARRSRRSQLPQPDVRSRKMVGRPEIPATASTSYCKQFHVMGRAAHSSAAVDDASMQVNATTAAVEPRPLVFAGLP